MSQKRSNESPERNKKRYLCSFNPEWLQKEFKQWLRKSNDFNTNCVYCESSFSIKSDGIYSINRHMNGLNHKKSSQAVRTSESMKSFLTPVNTPEEKRILAAEVSPVYHSIARHQS